MFKKTSAALVLAVLATAAYAQPNQAIVTANNQVNASVGIHDLEYHELDTNKITKGAYLDSETGNQPAVRFSYTGQSTVFGVSNMYLSTSLAVAHGHTDYDGYLQGNGKLTPYSGTTNVTTTDFSVRVGRGYDFAFLPDFQITPFVGLAHQSWIRDMQGQYGYKETYSHNSGEAGVLAQYAFSSKFVGGIDASLGRTFTSEMKSDGFDTFKLGNSTKFNYAVTADYAVNAHLHATASYRMTNFKYGQSAPNNGSFEPNSKSRTQELTVGVGYNF